MRTSFTAIALLVAIFCSCERSVKNSEWVEEKMNTNEVELPPSGRVGDPINFITTSIFGDDCWEFSRFNIISSGSDVYVTPYAKRPAKRVVCATVMTTVSGEGRFTPRFPGEYKFHFWRSDTLSLDYTVTVR
jgi:hypothetical protein